MCIDTETQGTETIRCDLKDEHGGKKTERLLLKCDEEEEEEQEP